MADLWTPTRHAGIGGRFGLYIHRTTRGGTLTDVTTVRNVPTQIESYSSSDPFGDSTAVFTFPAISPLDDLDAPDLAGWLGRYSNVDLWWLPGIDADTPGYEGVRKRTNPITQLPDQIAPYGRLAEEGTVLGVNGVKLWEGFIVSMDFTADESSMQLQVQCQGALFQVDHYLQKPFFPARPWPVEALIRQVFDRRSKPHLRTQPLHVVFPDGWTKVVPKYTGASANVYTPVAKPGSKWTGYATRQTGSWEHALTGFVQDQLTNLIVDDDSGVTPGNQWTVLHSRRTDEGNPGRRPVLKVRDRFRTPDFSFWVGTPGITCHLSADSTQSENVIYGDGTDVNGQVWRNAVIANNGSRTDYLPLAADETVYPPQKNSRLARGAFLSEAYVKFGTGFSQDDATTVAKQQLARDEDPGWSGTVTLSVDPTTSLTRWHVQAGMTVLIKGFAGSGEDGMPFHIAAVEASPMNGSVQLTVDTRYRDLLSVAEAQARARDPLNPVRMLQVNKASVMIEDVQAPWDYSAGSGYVPRKAKKFYDYKPQRDQFPYTDWTQKHAPLHYSHWYVKCNANAKTSQHRWAGPVPILTSAKGTIARTEFFCVDIYGRPLKIPFHVSIYYINSTSATAMPHLNGQYSPYLDGAFEKVDPKTGTAINPLLWPADGFIIGWGNRVDGVYNRAGFSPGSEAAGSPPTGQLFDDATWGFDNTQYHQFFAAANPPGAKPANTDIQLYAMFYAEHNEPVYFQGRLFRQNQGTG